MSISLITQNVTYLVPGGCIYAHHIICMSIYFCMRLITPFLFVCQQNNLIETTWERKDSFGSVLESSAPYYYYMNMGNRPGYSMGGRKPGDSPVGRLLLL